jgi:hypothetical protein
MCFAAIVRLISVPCVLTELAISRARNAIVLYAFSLDADSMENATIVIKQTAIPALSTMGETGLIILMK